MMVIKMKIEEKLKDILSILIIIILTFLFFHLVILESDEYKIPWDAFDQQYAWLNSTSSSYSKGEVPLWSNNYFSGFPIFEDPQVGTFYPGNIIFSIFANKNPIVLDYEYYIPLYVDGNIYVYVMQKFKCK